MLAEREAPWSQQWTLADLESRERRPNPGVRDDDVGLAHRLAQLVFGDRPMASDAEPADVGVTGLPEDLDLGRQDLQEAPYEPRERVAAIGAERDDDPAEPLARRLAIGPRGKRVEDRAAEAPPPALPAWVLGVAINSGDPADQPSGERGSVDPRGALYIETVNAASAGEPEERQGDCRARADHGLDLATAQGIVRPGEIARDVERVPAADEGDELDRLAGEQRAALRSVEGRPAVRALDARQPSVKVMQLLQVAAAGCDQQGRHDCQCSATSSRVPRMFALLEAPKTIDCTFGWPHTHSIASSGGIAPEAKTDIATARKRRSRRAAS